MRLMYIAGPYRASTTQGVRDNVTSARAVGSAVALKGWMPVVPHANTYGFERVPGLDNDEFFLEGTLELMRRCDAVVLAPGWTASSGSMREIQEAFNLGIPIYADATYVPREDDE